MKIGIKPTINKIKTNIKNYKYEQAQKEINKYVNIEQVTQPEAYKELYSAREILANYAKANNMRLTFKTKQLDKYNKTPQLSIWGKQNSHLAYRNVNSDTNAITTVERNTKRMLEDKDGLNYIANVRERRDETFLKRVYRSVESIKNEFKKL